MNWRAGRYSRPARSSRGFLAVIAFPLLMAGCGMTPSATAPWPDEVLLPPLPIAKARMPSDPIPAVFKRPPGKGPFPAVIVLHGCGGRGPSQLVWARRLNDWGYAALIPDSMTPRDIKRVCEPALQALVTPRDRVGDIGSAVAWLRTRRDIDPDRIAVLGLSHGGAAAALATQRIYQDFRLKAAVDYYGACVEPAAHGTVPLLVLAGEEDDWGHPALRCEAYAKAVGDGQVVEVHAYPGVHHAFDNPDMPLMVSNYHIMQYDPAAAEDSFIRTRAFLDHWVKQPDAPAGNGHVGDRHARRGQKYAGHEKYAGPGDGSAHGGRF
jgi:dienelactone hydrolase